MLTVASRVQLTWLSIGLVQMIKLSTWDLFRYQHFENYQRRSPAVRDTRFDSWSNRDLLAPCC
jgi:hypothetical protein